MFKNTPAFSGFSVPDMEAAKKFYNEKLGLQVDESPEGLQIHLLNDVRIFVYKSEKYVAPECTILNFIVEDIDKAIDELAAKGVQMEQYDLEYMKTDAKGVVRNDGTHPGPKAIAWFKDPADHIISVLQEK